MASRFQYRRLRGHGSQAGLKALAALLTLLLRDASCLAQDASFTVEQTMELRQQVNRESWDNGGDLSRFVYLHSSEVFPAAIVKRGGPVFVLGKNLRPEIAGFIVGGAKNPGKTLGELLASSKLDGFIIVHRGRIVFEAYPRMRPDDRHLLFSVSKVFVGTLVGILEARGQIDINKPIEAYLPELAHTHWAGVTVRDLLDMAGGMEGTDEDADAYTNPASRIFQMEATLGWQPISANLPALVLAGDTYGFIASLGKVRAPGVKREYSSIDTHVLAWVIERVTGKRLADVLSENIWSHIGAEGDAHLLLSERGVANAHSGLAMTLRDLARFGMAFTRSGMDTKSGAEFLALPTSHIDKLLHDGRPELLAPGHDPRVHHASYQWDQVGTQGELEKDGFGDQSLFVDRNRDLVIAYFGTNVTVDTPGLRLPLRELAARYFP
jgi:CubicO group peptidase (beta-lactamase class C family)